MIENFKPYRFKLPEFENKEQYLYYLYNNLGFTDLEICISKNKVFSKWVSYKYLLEKNGSEWIKGAFNQEKNRPYTRDEFIEECSHRRVMDIELMLDIDEQEVFGSIKDKSVFVYFKLKRLGFNPHVSFTGNKSYHISVLLPELRGLSKSVRAKVKRELLEEFGGDVQKGSDRCMISLLGAVHYKSGKNKEVCAWN